MAFSFFSDAASPGALPGALPGTKARGLLRRETMMIDGRRVPVHIRHNPRARRFIVKVDLTAGSVEIVTPYKSRLSEALQFADTQRDWIARRLADVPAPVAFTDGAVIPFRGQDHLVRHVARARRSAGTSARGPVRLVPPSLADLTDLADLAGLAALPEIHVTGAPEFIQRRVRDWLKAQARETLSDRAAHYCGFFELRPARIAIRDQTTRWGSCSAARVLSFSWRLILAPPHVLDYVAAHEVVHLRHMNHSRRFWAMLETAIPAVDPAKYWLEKHGPGLHRYGEKGLC